jgi:integrase
MERKELPKLPYGQGSMAYVPGRDDLIQFKKKINGKRITVYGKTSRECLSRMKEKEAELNEKEKLHHPTETNAVALLQDAISEWLVTFKKPMLKGRSYDTIEGTYLNQIKDTSLGRTSIQFVTSNDVQRHLNEIIDKKSESTAKKTMGLLKQFFDYYYARDINNNPMNIVKLPKKQRIYTDMEDIHDEDDMVVLSDEEIEMLTKELEKPYRNGQIGYTYGHMLLFMMWVYMRVGEVIALQYKDIDFGEKTIKVYKAYGKEKVRDEGSDKKYEWVLTTPKSKKGRRLLYMHDNAFEHLQKHLELNFPSPSPDTFIFYTKQNNPMPDQFLNTMLKKALIRAGIDKKVTIHGLRHTGISYFLRHGVPVEVISRMAGHSEIATTTRTYYGVIEDQKKNAYNGIEKDDPK